MPLLAGHLVCCTVEAQLRITFEARTISASQRVIGRSQNFIVKRYSVNVEATT